MNYDWLFHDNMCYIYFDENFHSILFLVIYIKILMLNLIIYRKSMILKAIKQLFFTNSSWFWFLLISCNNESQKLLKSCWSFMFLFILMILIKTQSWNFLWLRSWFNNIAFLMILHDIIESLLCYHTQFLLRNMNHLCRHSEEARNWKCLKIRLKI